MILFRNIAIFIVIIGLVLFFIPGEGYSGKVSLGWMYGFYFLAFGFIMLTIDKIIHFFRTQKKPSDID